MARSGKPSPSDGSKPKVHVTHTGGRYVNADELLRSPQVKAAIDSMAQIAQEDTGKESPPRRPPPPPPSPLPESRKPPEKPPPDTTSIG